MKIRIKPIEEQRLEWWLEHLSDLRLFIKYEYWGHFYNVLEEHEGYFNTTIGGVRYAIPKQACEVIKDEKILSGEKPDATKYYYFSNSMEFSDEHREIPSLCNAYDLSDPEYKYRNWENEWYKYIKEAE